MGLQTLQNSVDNINFVQQRAIGPPGGLNQSINIGNGQLMGINSGGNNNPLSYRQGNGDLSGEESIIANKYSK